MRRFAREGAERGEFKLAFNPMTEWDRDVSRRLAERGWVGTTIPEEYGGHPRPAPEQWVIAEELLAGGVPLGGHWICDRQIARMILRFAGPDLKRSLLPLMARGELTVALGMSEPGSGSDLASVRTRADRVEDGWVVNGQKIWTSNAHNAEYALVLCRTDPEAQKHEGLSQLLIDLKTPGVEIRRIPTADGEDDFCEVFFDDVFVPDHHLVGEPGSGWTQITTELSYERAWPDRYLTYMRVLEAFRETVADEADDRAALETLGGLAARLASIRGLSWNAVATAIADRDASALAALAKDAGTCFEQALLEAVRRADPRGRRHEPGELREALRVGVAMSPVITIRGGTSEILRGVVGKRLQAPVFRSEERSLVEESVEELLAGECTVEALTRWDEKGWSAELWGLFDELGFASALGRDDEEELSLADACSLLRLAAYHAAPAPIAESGFLAGWLIERAGATRAAGSGPTAVAPVREGQSAKLDGNGVLTGLLTGVPFASVSERLAVLVETGDGPALALIDIDSLSIDAAAPAEAALGDDVDLTGVALDDSSLFPLSDPSLADAFRVRGALARAVQMAGAMERALDLAVAHAGDRQQFGRQIRQFQAVRDHLVIVAREVALSRAAVKIAVDAARGASDLADPAVMRAVAVAKTVTGNAVFEVAARTHQVHGAIGTTREYPLHFLTSRLAAWRDDFGDEGYWSRLLGRELCSEPSVWDYVTRLEVVA